IRGFHVTGVQTCALPISSPPRPPLPPSGPPAGTYFSRRKLTAPLPPSPPLTKMRAVSRNTAPPPILGRTAAEKTRGDPSRNRPQLFPTPAPPARTDGSGSAAAQHGARVRPTRARRR